MWSQIHPFCIIIGWARITHSINNTFFFFLSFATPCINIDKKANTVVSRVSTHGRSKINCILAHMDAYPGYKFHTFV